MSNMPMENSKEISTALATYFALPDEVDDFEVIRKKLIEEIQYLIDYDLNKLWNVLYRIDVFEKKVRNVIATTPHTEHAVHIANLIIERQQEKIISRKKYKA